LKAKVLFVLALLLAPALASAADSVGYRFELTPRVGYNWGGTLKSSETQFNANLDARNSASYGVSFDIPLSSFLQLELLASRQKTELDYQRGLFVPNVSIADFDVSYYHVGLLWQGHRGQVVPFFVASIGGTELAPRVPGATSDNRFSASLGGGVKVFFDQHIGLRFEGRGFWTAMSKGHDRYYSRDYTYSNDFSQGQASVGLIFAF